MMKWAVALDRAIAKRTAVARTTGAMRLVGPVSDTADQWLLFGVCFGTTATGIGRRDRKLAATGLRMP